MQEKMFCERLSELRLKQGVSARDMSLSLGQSESYINRIESRKMLPSLSAFFYICEYFNITPKDFFSYDESFYEFEITKAINKLRSMDVEKRKHILAIISDL